MEEDAKIAAQKSGRLSFYVVNAIADGCTMRSIVTFFLYRLVVLVFICLLCKYQLLKCILYGKLYSV